MRLLLLSSLVVVAASASAQLPGLPGGGGVRIDLPGIENLLFKQEDPFSTALKDAWEGCKFLDGWEPLTQPLTNEMRNAKGIWQLKAGAYRAEIRTFCGKGYTYGPSRGMGYATAPWKGKHAQIIQNLVRRFSQSNENQQTTQQLIWAILARGKPSKFSTELKGLAARLLKPDEIRELEGLSLDALGEDVMRRLMGKAEAGLRPLYEAENRVRGYAYQANRPFADFERAMMREAPADLPSTINRGRWIWHPNRYFFRLQPIHYSRSVFEVVVPHKPEITRDAKGRITRLECPPGWISEVEWDDTKPAATCPGDPKLTMHFFKKVRLIGPDPDRPGQTRTEEREAPGFMFAGTPTKRGELSFWSSLIASITPTLQDWVGRLETANDQYERFSEYRSHYERMRRIEEGRASSDDFFDMSHYRDGIWSIFTGGGVGWILEHHGRQAEAVAAATDTLSTLPDGSSVDPSDGVFMPGNPGSQRLIGGASAW